MALTGKKRSLTLSVNKTLAGEVVSGYPRVYYGQNSFEHAGVLYEAITDEDLALMPVDSYTTRIAAFKAYVELQETGLNIDEVQTNQAYF